MRGHTCERSKNVFDVELEAHRALVMLREARDYTDDCDVAAFPVCAELICESDVTDERSPEESRCEADGGRGAALEESR